MRIAVTDACIFIDLLELNIVSPFFNLDLEVHTTAEVMDELYHEQQEILIASQSVNKLTVHNLSVEDLATIRVTAFSKALSQQDKSVIYLASKLEATVLSSDKPVRDCAKRMAIETHGMFWIFDQLVDHKLLNAEQATNRLHQLMNTNLMYRNNVLLWKEANKRFTLWGDDG